MQGEQRERLIALAAKVAAEGDPVKLHVLKLELDQMLSARELPLRINEKTSREAPPGK